MNSRGQALLESLLATMVLMTLGSSALLMAYLVFARLWIQYQLDKTVICTATSVSAQSCVQKLSERMSQTLRFGKWQASSWQSEQNYYVKASYELSGKVKWQWQRQLDVEKIGKKARRRSH